MVPFDDGWRPIGCPWILPYHCPSGIVLDVKSRLIRKEYVAPLLWCPIPMFMGQCHRALTFTGDKGTQATGRRASSAPSCSLRDTVWRDMSLPAAAEICDASCHAVSILRHLADYKRKRSSAVLAILQHPDPRLLLAF
ncbi:hypothetical protein AVEN_28358-1 [Araneus ventricosus]|uniref:Uncharacterized protein n=1 Tax=Araneus ventricosus TaxID=182803 RepID=A0A4Y2FAM1_ARAVE|nr:hypothetical protein AVEN_28358-1 [Araneus ventricosus]